MKDAEVRGLILKQLYGARHASDFMRIPDDLSISDISPHVLGNVATQLREQGLIDFHEVLGHSYRSGSARILSYGVDVVEGNSAAPISITFDHSVSVHGSTHVQIGQGNVQNVAGLEQLNIAIEEATATQNEKAEAKSLLKQLSENKLLRGILAAVGIKIN